MFVYICYRTLSKILKPLKMNQITSPKRQRSISVMGTQPSPKSIFDYTPAELNEIDRFQNINRGFIDDDVKKRMIGQIARGGQRDGDR